MADRKQGAGLSSGSSDFSSQNCEIHYKVALVCYKVRIARYKLFFSELQVYISQF